MAITTRTQTEAIYADLKTKLGAGVLRPGVKLKPTDLQGEYGCSANTVRDVLMRLSNFGLVEFQLQRGFRATPGSLTRRSDVAKFRLLLEQEGVAGSMRQGGVAWEAKLAAAHQKLLHIERQIQREGGLAPFQRLWTEAEWEFHQTLISACASPMLIETYERVYLQFRQQNSDHARDFGVNFFETIVAEHQAIVDAALARNAAACRAAIEDHLKRNILPDAGMAAA